MNGGDYEYMNGYDLARYCANIVSPVFRMMGWTWGEGTPTYNDIAEQIEELIDMCEVGGTVSTGRIMVNKYKDEDGQIETRVYLELGQAVNNEK